MNPLLGSFAKWFVLLEVTRWFDAGLVTEAEAVELGIHMWQEMVYDW